MSNFFYVIAYFVWAIIMKKYNIALIGATGLVGRTFLKVLEEYDIPINNLFLYASNKSVGKKLTYKNKEYICRILDESSFKNIDFAVFCTSKEISNKYAEMFEKEGSIVIDNSSNFRMYKDIALIVPEINMEDFYNSKRKIIANPNCSTIQCVLALNALKKKYKIKRIIYNTYQSISGAGKAAIDDYYNCINGNKNSYFPYNITKTCIPKIDEFINNRYTKEEMKMINETKKILHDESLLITSTCVRVPVLYSHFINILVEFDSIYNMNDIYKLLNEQEGIKIIDDIFNNIYPTSIYSNNNDFVYVGRIRKDLSNDKALLISTVSDNLRKGAASNVVQIIKKLITLD